MKVMIIGAGRIGRGYVSELLLLNNCEITYFDQKAIIDKLNEVKSYTIHVLGNPNNDLKHENYKAYDIENETALYNALRENEFVFTAVGGKHLKEIGEKLGKAYKKLIENNDIHIQNIVTCENWINPATDLRESIEQQLDGNVLETFNINVGISESIIVATGTGCPKTYTLTNEMDTWVQNIRFLPIDKERLKGVVPNWQYFEFRENFGNLLIQKIYTNNTSCTAMSYIGLLYGYEILCEACNDKYLIQILDELYVEINAALIQGLGIDKDSQLEFSRHAKEKYTDLDIIDPMTRIARDPIRKLRPEDRFVTPARLALKVGVKPWAIAMGMAASFFYEDENDDSAGDLTRMRKEEGIPYILKNVCGLSENEELYSLVLQEVDKLKEKGLVK